MIQLYEILVIGGITFLSFIGIVIVRGGTKLAAAVALAVSVVLVVWDAKLEEDTGRGIAGNLYCKLAQCRDPATGPGPVNPAANRPVSSDSAMMTGVFGSQYGPVEISPEGGRYRDFGGTLTVERVSGSTIEGRWEQKGGMFATRCADQRSYGRFRFDFDRQGFLGRWSACDGPYDKTWDGWRPKTLYFRNLCGRPVDLWLRWTDDNGAWQASGPWAIAANERRRLEGAGNAGATPIRAASRQMFVRVVERHSGRVILEGTEQVDVNGSLMGMQAAQSTEVADGLEIPVDCNGGNGTNLVVS